MSLPIGYGFFLSFSKLLYDPASDSGIREVVLMTSEAKTQMAIFWDVENVSDEALTHKTMTEKIRQSGHVVKAYAFADWDPRRHMAEELYALGYDLIHIPDSKDNASDYKMASYILDHLMHYPETTRYVMITGDGDFKLLVGSLKERGVELWLISNPVITASELPNLATMYSDIFSFRPSLDCVRPEDCDESVQSIVQQRHIAGVQLQEVIRTITKTGSKPGAGHAKHVMSSLNPDFNEKRLEFSSWHDFLDWAEAQRYIDQEGELPGTVLALPKELTAQSVKISKDVSEAFDFLAMITEENLNEGPPPSLRSLGIQMRERGLEFEKVGYRRFSDFVMSAEKRGRIRIMPAEDEHEGAIVLPVYSPERMTTWFEENVKRLFGESVNVPKPAFMKKISLMLLETRTTLQQLETYLLDETVRSKYKGILEASGIPFLPPFQMSMAHILIGKGMKCGDVLAKVNSELHPLGIKLSCPE
ncbi:MAG: NYN domain-containing protein [Candidatus Thorarchaeota archaeon]|nr:MAG: NYN domain-containing protein [Candidatus Thorarchaeota archaeon]